MSGNRLKSRGGRRVSLREVLLPPPLSLSETGRAGHSGVAVASGWFLYMMRFFQLPPCLNFTQEYIQPLTMFKIITAALKDMRNAQNRILSYQIQHVITERCSMLTNDPSGRKSRQIGRSVILLSLGKDGVKLRNYSFLQYTVTTERLFRYTGNTLENKRPQH